MIKNQAATVPFYLYNPTNGQGATGATSISVFISKDGGTPVAATNSPSEVSSANSPGNYKILLTASEMNADVIQLTFSHATYKAMPLTITTELAAPTVAAIQDGLATSEALSTVGTNVSAVKAKTDNLPANPASATDVSGLLALLNKIFAGIFNWGLSHDVLTIYENGVATATFQITRDSSGNITAIVPTEDSSSSGGDEE